MFSPPPVVEQLEEELRSAVADNGREAAATTAIEDGFLFFGNFPDLLSYHDVDDVQRYHRHYITALSITAASAKRIDDDDASSSSSAERTSRRLKTLLCHDMMGGYLAHERLGGVSLAANDTGAAALEEAAAAATLAERQQAAQARPDEKMETETERSSTTVIVQQASTSLESSAEGIPQERQSKRPPSTTVKEPCYVFAHWWYIDAFVYFSHHFITVPPLVWTNQAHLHDVPILGEWRGLMRTSSENIAIRPFIYRLLAFLFYRYSHHRGRRWCVDVRGYFRLAGECEVVGEANGCALCELELRRLAHQH